MLDLESTTLKPAWPCTRCGGAIQVYTGDVQEPPLVARCANCGRDPEGPQLPPKKMERGPTPRGEERGNRPSCRQCGNLCNRDRHKFCSTACTVLWREKHGQIARRYGGL